MQHRYAPLLATLVVLAVNAAASILPINGISTGELSDLYPTGFTPPGWVFSIWGLIYTGLIAYSLTALRGNSRARQRAAVIQGPYLLNAIGNAGWIFAWHYREVELSVLLMLFILATLIVIFLRLRRLPNSTWGEYFTIDAPFSLYFGWITAATLINIATLFFDWGRYPLGLSMDEWALATVTFAIAWYVGYLFWCRNRIRTRTDHCADGSHCASYRDCLGALQSAAASQSSRAVSTSSRANSLKIS
ncbi:MAG: tryptophan-rich sensory protein [Steroidobacteraceae bacterium]